MNLKLSCVSIQGKHAYHNYTIRRLYRPFPQKPYKSRPNDRSDDEKHGKSSTVISGSEFEFLDEEDLTEELSDVLAGELADEMVNTFADDIQCVEKVSKTSTVSLPGGTASDRRAWWLPTPDGSDKVWSSHFRKVLSCTCEMPEMFGETQFTRISITGSSFMVHQVQDPALFNYQLYRKSIFTFKCINHSLFELIFPERPYLVFFAYL